MLRDNLGERGEYARKQFVEEIYDIKTVAQRYKVSGDCKMNYTLVIDLEASEIIWLNVASSSLARVGSLANSDFINDIINDTELLNYETFAQICANKVVKDINKADVIFTSNNNYVAPNKEVKVIRPCDYEEILKILK
jgi:DNA-binding Lrp family transcriptional regulator